jgi:uncharacterized membrane protein
MTQEQTGRRFDLTDAAAVALAIIQAALAVYIYGHGPAGRIAVHFDLYGRPNGWADRQSLGLGMGGLAAFTLLVNLTVRLGQAAAGNLSRTTLLTRALLLAVAALLTALFANLAFAPAEGVAPQRLSLTLAWLIVVVVGAFVGKAAPNAFVGVRVYWTLRSRLAWDKANRLLGRILFFGGLIGILAMPFVDAGKGQALVIVWFLVVGLGGGALAIFESWRVWRVDPERIP